MWQLSKVNYRVDGSGALSDMLLVRIVNNNNKIDAYFRAG